MGRFVKACLFLLVSCFAMQAVAEDDLFEQDDQGQIDYVDLKVRNIVIDDLQYRLALDLKVHGKRGLETDFALKQGSRVKYEVNPSTIGQGTTTITNIWILQE